MITITTQWYYNSNTNDNNNSINSTNSTNSNDQQTPTTRMPTNNMLYEKKYTCNWTESHVFVLALIASHHLSEMCFCSAGVCWTINIYIYIYREREGLFIYLFSCTCIYVCVCIFLSLSLYIYIYIYILGAPARDEATRRGLAECCGLLCRRWNKHASKQANKRAYIISQICISQVCVETNKQVT